MGCDRIRGITITSITTTTTTTTTAHKRWRMDLANQLAQLCLGIW
ncbi:hypothetical protein [uncultured Thiodictyon sp.]|nr:hypothetical protein [uncultured Thiodictyon sp.]